MIAENAVARITTGLSALNQRAIEELAMHKLDGGDNDVIDAALTQHERAGTELHDIDLQIEQVQADATLSPLGQQQKVAKIVQAGYQRLAFVAKAAQDRQAAADEARKALEALPKSADDPIVDYLRSMEIRQQLRTLAQPERMKLFVEAMDRGEAAILRAINGDPMGREALIPTDYLDRVREETAQRTQPKAWRRLQALDLATDRFRILAGAIEAVLGSYGSKPTITPPPIRKLDLGLKNQTEPPAKGAADKPEPVGAFQ